MYSVEYGKRGERSLLSVEFEVLSAVHTHNLVFGYIPASVVFHHVKGYGVSMVASAVRAEQTVAG